MSISFAHVVNTISPDDNPSLIKIQYQTCKSMLIARNYCSDKIAVELLSAQYADARQYVPEGFNCTENLQTCAAFHPELATEKRLPLISEIIGRLKENKTATHFIYTNLDICLMPFFYKSVATYIKKGHDGIVINRVRIEADFIDEHDIVLLYAEAGKKHPGFDCFIFSRQLLQQFVLKDIYIGAPPAGTDIFHNIFAFSNNPILLTGKHLTYHIGLDLVKHWGSPSLNKHNQRQFKLMFNEIKTHIDITKFPGYNDALLRRHFKWLMNPALHYPTLALLDIKHITRKQPLRPQKKRLGLKNKYFEWLFKATGFKDSI